jgi:uncharacterized membrane protein
MSKERLLAFSDGVIAILITIMVLELKAPEGSDWHAVRPLLPVLASYVLSFVFLGIYWSNHHHMLQMTERVNGRILWANLHLLFWLSLTPFVTAWLGEVGVKPLPTALYGTVLFLSAAGYTILQMTIIADQGPDSRLAAAVGKDTKGKISAALYALAIPMSFVQPLVSIGLYIVMAVWWLVPDRRIERHLLGS